MGLKRRFSITELPLAEARDRVRGLAASQQRVLADYVSRQPEATCAWIDGAFEPGSLFSVDPLVAAIVFASPINTRRSIVLRLVDLLGTRAQRDSLCVLFLGPVKARDLCVVPDTLAIFSAGLEVERFACFDGGDSHTEIADHLRAPFVLTGFGYGYVSFARATKVEVANYATDLPKRPRGGKRFDSLEEMLPFVGDTAEDLQAWEFISDFVADGREIPKGKAFQKPAKRKNEIKGRRFCFVGRLANRYFSTKDVRRSVEFSGGIVVDKVDEQLDYLVIGDVSSPLLGKGAKSAAHRRAEALIRDGASIQIIGEQAFYDLSAFAGKERRGSLVGPN